MNPDDFSSFLFDLDGTLIDSMWVWSGIDKEYLGRFGLEVPKDLQKKINGLSMYETAVYHKEQFGITDEPEKIMDDWNRMAFRYYTQEVRLKDGAAQFLRECRKNGKKTAIATSNSRELAEAVLEVNHIKEYFDVIITGSEIRRGKPFPDVYLACAERTDSKPEKCLVFEDIPAGIKAGKAAGMKVCAVYDRSSEDQDPEKLRLADYYIRNFEELLIR